MISVIKWAWQAKPDTPAEKLVLVSLANSTFQTPREDIAVVGIQPELLDDYGGSLTETVKARIPEALEAARGILSEWGFPPVERAPGERVPPLSFQSLSIDAYESGRPDEAEACRTGDERFLVRPAGHASDPS